MAELSVQQAYIKTSQYIMKHKFCPTPTCQKYKNIKY